MKRVKNSIMGIVLIGLAVLLIANQVGYDLFPSGITGLRIVYLAICGLVLIDGLLEQNLWTIGFATGFGYWVLAKPCGWPHISIWVLLLTVIMVCSGLEMIFHKKKRSHIKISHKDWEEAKEEGVFDSGERYYGGGDGLGKDAVFSNVTRYIQDTDFRGGEIDVVFSSVQLYFDQAKLHNDRAILDIDAVFSSVVIYVPKEWTVINNTNRVCCRRSRGDILGNGDQTLVIEGDCVFGGIRIEQV